MKYQHFFWDFDGTLYDTYGRITRATAAALGDFGVSVTPEEVYPVAKRSLFTVCAKWVEPLGYTYAQFMDCYHRHSEVEGAESIRPFPGALDTLRAVVAHGGRNYLYTHRSESVFHWLAYDGITDLFADKVTTLDGFPSKPAPDALNYLVNKHGLTLSECVMVGDRDIDLDAGKNAGMACALFDPDDFYPDYDTPWRFHTMDGLRKSLVE
ncbi:MAG: HAD hydrolase-like protein [Clostridia bacterium]|nr:HAD hydrolase-like protein [Clostridia bacterium]MBR0408247.1 HAD hydrolase-like protein [Clostridia bacterium]